MQIKRLIETKFCPFQVLFLPIPSIPKSSGSAAFAGAKTLLIRINYLDCHKGVARESYNQNARHRVVQKRRGVT